MQKIIIENFRQVSHAEIEITNFLLFIGEQASGKSTIAKLIYFFKSLREEYRAVIADSLNKNTNAVGLSQDFVKKIQNKFKTYFGYTSELKDNFKITFYYDFDKNQTLTLSKTDSSAKKTLRIVFNTNFYEEIKTNLNNVSIEAKKIQILRQQAEETEYKFMAQMSINLEQDLYKKIDNLFKYDFTPAFFPAGRYISTFFSEYTRTLIQTNLAKENVDKNSVNSIDSIFLEEFLNHVNFLKRYFERLGLSQSSTLLDFFDGLSTYILKGKYVQDKQEEFISSNDVKISVSAASSGQQESLRIVQDLLYLIIKNQKSFRVVEEPEAHLYPKAQKYLIELMALTINLTSSQIIITSHSPYILSIVNNLLLYSQTIHKNPNSKSLIETHFGTDQLDPKRNEKINLETSQVQAYLLDVSAENYCVSAIDTETGLIGNNFLDNETEALNNDFETLYHLYFKN